MPRRCDQCGRFAPHAPITITRLENGTGWMMFGLAYYPRAISVVVSDGMGGKMDLLCHACYQTWAMMHGVPVEIGPNGYVPRRTP